MKSTLALKFFFVLGSISLTYFVWFFHSHSVIHPRASPSVVSHPGLQSNLKISHNTQLETVHQILHEMEGKMKTDSGSETLFFPNDNSGSETVGRENGIGSETVSHISDVEQNQLRRELNHNNNDNNIINNAAADKNDPPPSSKKSDEKVSSTYASPSSSPSKVPPPSREVRQSLESSAASERRQEKHPSSPSSNSGHKPSPSLSTSSSSAPLSSSSSSRHQGQIRAHQGRISTAVHRVTKLPVPLKIPVGNLANEKAGWYVRPVTRTPSGDKRPAVVHHLPHRARLLSPPVPRIQAPAAPKRLEHTVPKPHPVAVKKEPSEKKGSLEKVAVSSEKSRESADRKESSEKKDPSVVSETASELPENKEYTKVLSMMKDSSEKKESSDKKESDAVPEKNPTVDLARSTDKVAASKQLSSSQHHHHHHQHHQHHGKMSDTEKSELHVFHDQEVSLHKSDAEVEQEMVEDIMKVFGLESPPPPPPLFPPPSPEVSTPTDENGSSNNTAPNSPPAPPAPPSRPPKPPKSPAPPVPHFNSKCAPEDMDCRQNWCKAHSRDNLPPLKPLGFPLAPPQGKLGRFNWTQLVMHQHDMQTLEKFNKKLLPADAHEAVGHIRWGGRCAVVGNAGHLLNTKYGAEIDQFDVVIRLNQAPTAGYEEHVGKKTSMRIMNRLWSVAYGKVDEIRSLHLPLEKDLTVVVSRGEDLLHNYHRMKSALRSYRPDVKVVALSFPVVAHARTLLGTFRRCLKATNRYWPGGGVPSSGMVAVFALKEICSQVSAYGMGRPLSDKPAKYQYYVLGKTQREHGNPTHSFGTEEQLLRALADQNFITYCTDIGCTGTPIPKRIRA